MNSLSDLEQITFAWPWLSLFFLLPLLVRRISPGADVANDAALRLPVADAFSGVVDGAGITGSLRTGRLLLALVAWALLIVGVMRPQLPADSQSAPVTGRNLMLAVDLSGSMENKDFELAGRSVERLTATKAVGGDFIDRRVGDRLGLILFGERAYLQAPLTFDRSTVKTLLYESTIGIAGQKTAIGDAIALAVKRVRETGKSEDQQVLVLMTDGANTAGNIEPLKAAELAAATGLKIYTIGIGSDGRGNALRRLAGGSSDLDEKNLNSIAELTGGRYFRARDTQGLAAIYRELDQLEPAAEEEDGFQPKDEMFFWPVSLSVLLVALMTLPSLRQVFSRS